MIMTWIVPNEFRTDTDFSSVSPLDNFSQIIFASAHSFIMEKISPFGFCTTVIVLIKYPHYRFHHEAVLFMFTDKIYGAF